MIENGQLLCERAFDHATLRIARAMLISHTHRFLFVHTIRSGGTSVARALEPFAHRPPDGLANRYLSKLGLVRDPRRIRLREHETALRARRLLPRDVFDSYFKFAFVRNPWSWLVSVWSRLRTTESHRHYRVVSKLDFPSYIDWEVSRNQRHQHPFVCDERRELLVDFVGRQENLAADFAGACESIGLEGVELAHIGGRPHADYREYFDEALREKVRAHWAADIELFGYDFEPHETSPPPLTRQPT